MRSPSTLKSARKTLPPSSLPMTCPLHVPLHLPERSRSVRGLLHSHLTPPQPGAMSATAINRSPTGRMPPLLRGTRLPDTPYTLSIVPPGFTHPIMFQYGSDPRPGAAGGSTFTSTLNLPHLG